MDFARPHLDSSNPYGGPMTERVPVDEEVADAATQGRDAGRQARLELVRSGYGEEFLQSWLYGYLSGFVETTAPIANFEPSLPARGSIGKAAVEGAGSFTARVLASSVHRRTAGEELRTLSLDIEGIPVQYRAGDELALLPSNSPDSVREVLRMLGLNPQTRIRTKAGSGPIWQVLLERVNLERVPEAVYELMAQCANNKDERAALGALAVSNEQQARPLVTLLRRFPRIRPGVDELLQSLERLEPSFVPIASACGASSRLDTLILNKPTGGYGTLDPGLLARCQPGEWLTFSLTANVYRDTSFDPLTPVVYVSDSLGAAIVRAQLLQRITAAHRGRSWILGLGAWGESSPYVNDATEWLKSGACRAVDCLPERVPDFEAGFAAIEDTLWRWLVDHASLYVAVTDVVFRERFTERLRRLIAMRSRIDEAASIERLQSLQREGQLIYWQQAKSHA